MIALKKTLFYGKKLYWGVKLWKGDASPTKQWAKFERLHQTENPLGHRRQTTRASSTLFASWEPLCVSMILTARISRRLICHKDFLSYHKPCNVQLSHDAPSQTWKRRSILLNAESEVEAVKIPEMKLLIRYEPIEGNQLAQQSFESRLMGKSRVENLSTTSRDILHLWRHRTLRRATKILLHPKIIG